MSGEPRAEVPPTPRLSLSSTPFGPAVIVWVMGEVDVVTAPRLLTMLDRHLADPEVGVSVLDLSQVEFLGASGLVVLAELATRAATGGPRALGTVLLVAPATHRPVVRPWRLMNLDDVVPLYPTVLDALEGRDDLPVRARSDQPSAASRTTR